MADLFNKFKRFKFLMRTDYNTFELTIYACGIKCARRFAQEGDCTIVKILERGDRNYEMPELRKR
jgi:hypothetical protein